MVDDEFPADPNTALTKTPGLCGAKTRSGSLCRRRPVNNGTGRCKLHGGRSLRGIASPRFRHGSRSKYLPASLRARYLRALHDPDLLVLRSDLALQEARICDLLGRLEVGGGAELWPRAQKALNQFKAAQAERDASAMVAALTGLEDVIGAGQRDTDVWTALQATIEQKRRLAETETKRLSMAHRVLTEERAFELLHFVLHTLKARIADRALLALLVADFERVLGGPAGLEGEGACR
jgi:hypothetical protein